MIEKKLRIAAFGGFRDIPPKEGGAGSDKFAVELYPRIVSKGHELIAYTRIYPKDKNIPKENFYEGVKKKALKTVNKAGFDSLVHSCKATFHIIFHNTADCVHLHSGANSMWAIPLKLAGKKVIITQFAMDWKRDKWPWYGKLFYLVSNFLTAHIPDKVIFDNIFTKEYFEKKYNKRFEYIPYGSEVAQPSDKNDVLCRLGIKENKYLLFVGRFIPDKGIHLLIEAFEKTPTQMNLVLIGGSPNPDPYELKLKATKDPRIIFPGYIYGEETNILIKKCYSYVQPSLIEGLSPVILTVMGLGTPLICSDIRENVFITRDNAILFSSGNIRSLRDALIKSLSNEIQIRKMAANGKKDVLTRFNWNTVSNQYIEKFKELMI